MRYALFLGCQIPARVKHYEFSTRAVLEYLGVDLEDVRQFNCCGYPMRNSDKTSFLLSSLKNLALAEKIGLDILVLCKCCYGSLKKAAHLMMEEGTLQDEIRMLLREEGLHYEGKYGIKHLLSVLKDDIGTENIKKKISNPYKGLKIAAHYGCHALRPSEITEFDNPVEPSLFESLIEVTGAKTLKWPMRLECCGAPALGINDNLSMSLTNKKLEDAERAGADYLVTACPYCQIQFDNVQYMMTSKDGKKNKIGSILFPQLLGLSMGIDSGVLGLGANKINVGNIIEFLSEE